MTWKRARTDEQKEVRITEIVSATARLYEKLDYEEINLALIAKEALFTRSNLYKYFTTKEEIFIELIKNDLTLWTDDIETAYKKKEDISIEEFATLWVETFMKHERLASLFPILFTSLEKNATLDNLIDFKFQLKQNLEVIVGILCRLFPELTIEHTMSFISLQLSVAIGLYPLVNMTDKQIQAMKHVGMEQTQVDFAQEYKKAVVYIIRGLLGEDCKGIPEE